MSFHRGASALYGADLTSQQVLMAWTCANGMDSCLTSACHLENPCCAVYCQSLPCLKELPTVWDGLDGVSWGFHLLTHIWILCGVRYWCGSAGTAHLYVVMRTD